MTADLEDKIRIDHQNPEVQRQFMLFIYKKLVQNSHVLAENSHVLTEIRKKLTDFGKKL